MPTKKTKKETVKKSRVEKPYNNGTMSQSAFFGMIRSALRQCSRWWKPIAQCKQNAKRKYVGTNKLQKWEYNCNICKGWFKDKDVQIDHIKESGELKSFEDLPKFVENLFCEVQGLQCLCKPCHKEKTDEYMKNKKSSKKE